MISLSGAGGRRTGKRLAVTRIFISYRRDDDPYAARGINNALCERFGEQHVYFDLDDIQAGLDFRTQIDEMLAKCDVELSRFSGRVNTEVYSVSPSLGRGKLPPRSGGVKGNLATQVSHAAAPWRRSKLMGDS